jgi:hypothetical protein
MPRLLLRAPSYCCCWDPDASRSTRACLAGPWNACRAEAGVQTELN